MLHGPLFSCEWPRQAQMTDHILSDQCYMIAFDMFYCGGSRCPNYVSKDYVLQHDIWAEAALIALFAHALDLPPFHIFAELGLAVDLSLRFAILWPKQCLSLTLVGIYPAIDPPAFQEAYLQQMQQWLGARDFETVEEAQAGFLHLHFSTFKQPPVMEPEEEDRFMEYWQIHHNSAQADRGLLGVCIAARFRVPMTDHELARVKQPVQIIQGGDSPTVSVEPARILQQQLVNSDCCQVEIIQNGSACLSAPARFVPRVNQIFSLFLATQALAEDEDGRVHAGSEPCKVDEEDMRRALKVLAQLTREGGPEREAWVEGMEERDPMVMWSFGRMPGDMREMAKNLFIPLLTQAARDGVTLLGPDGRPPRKYSERANRTFLPSKADDDAPEPSEPAPGTPINVITGTMVNGAHSGYGRRGSIIQRVSVTTRPIEE